VGAVCASVLTVAGVVVCGLAATGETAQAAADGAGCADGLWTLGDPEQAPEIIEAYKEARAKAGKEAGEIIFQSGFHLGPDDESAIASSRKWKPTQLPEVYTDDIHDPAEMVRMADEQMSDEEFAAEGFIIGGDLDEHVQRIREIEDLGATTVCLQLIGQADPMGTIEQYGERVLPALRG